MIKVEWFYWLCGFLFLVTALVRLRDREDNKRFGSVRPIIQIVWVPHGG